eukprot:GHVH01017144.1.p1 GENE.GHVH01017144.1~~GHVH01017144.1.p1  ORF type:complete len:1571 (-),score=221.00 GHVH01017144.1:56-4768(-)
MSQDSIEEGEVTEVEEVTEVDDCNHHEPNQRDRKTVKDQHRTTPLPFDLPTRRREPSRNIPGPHRRRGGEHRFRSRSPTYHRRARSPSPVRVHSTRTERPRERWWRPPESRPRVYRYDARRRSSRRFEDRSEPVPTRLLTPPPPPPPPPPPESSDTTNHVSSLSSPPLVPHLPETGSLSSPVRYDPEELATVSTIKRKRRKPATVDAKAIPIPYSSPPHSSPPAGEPSPPVKRRQTDVSSKKDEDQPSERPASEGPFCVAICDSPLNRVRGQSHLDEFIKVFVLLCVHSLERSSQHQRTKSYLVQLLGILKGLRQWIEQLPVKTSAPESRLQTAYRRLPSPNKMRGTVTWIKRSSHFQHLLAVAKDYVDLPFLTVVQTTSGSEVARRNSEEPNPGAQLNFKHVIKHFIYGFVIPVFRLLEDKVEMAKRVDEVPDEELVEELMSWDNIVTVMKQTSSTSIYLRFLSDALSEKDKLMDSVGVNLYNEVTEWWAGQAEGLLSIPELADSLIDCDVICDDSDSVHSLSMFGIFYFLLAFQEAHPPETATEAIKPLPLDNFVHLDDYVLRQPDGGESDVYAVQTTLLSRLSSSRIREVITEPSGRDADNMITSINNIGSHRQREVVGVIRREDIIAICYLSDVASRVHCLSLAGSSGSDPLLVWRRAGFQFPWELSLPLEFATAGVRHAYVLVSPCAASTGVVVERERNNGGRIWALAALRVPEVVTMRNQLRGHLAAPTYDRIAQFYRTTLVNYQKNKSKLAASLSTVEELRKSFLSLQGHRVISSLRTSWGIIPLRLNHQKHQLSLLPAGFQQYDSLSDWNVINRGVALSNYISNHFPTSKSSRSRGVRGEDGMGSSTTEFELPWARAMALTTPQQEKMATITNSATRRLWHYVMSRDYSSFVDESSKQSSRLACRDALTGHLKCAHNSDSRFDAIAAFHRGSGATLRKVEASLSVVEAQAFPEWVKASRSAKYQHGTRTSVLDEKPNPDHDRGWLNTEGLTCAGQPPAWTASACLRFTPAVDEAASPIPLCLSDVPFHVTSTSPKLCAGIISNPEQAERFRDECVAWSLPQLCSLLQQCLLTPKDFASISARTGRSRAECVEAFYRWRSDLCLHASSGAPVCGRWDLGGRGPKYECIGPRPCGYTLEIDPLSNLVDTGVLCCSDTLQYLSSFYPTEFLIDLVGMEPEFVEQLNIQGLTDHHNKSLPSSEISLLLSTSRIPKYWSFYFSLELIMLSMILIESKVVSRTTNSDEAGVISGYDHPPYPPLFAKSFNDGSLRIASHHRYPSDSSPTFTPREVPVGGRRGGQAVGSIPDDATRGILHYFLRSSVDLGWFCDFLLRRQIVKKEKSGDGEWGAEGVRARWLIGTVMNGLATPRTARGRCWGVMKGDVMDEFKWLIYEPSTVDYLSRCFRKRRQTMKRVVSSLQDPYIKQMRTKLMNSEEEPSREMIHALKEEVWKKTESKRIIAETTLGKLRHTPENLSYLDISNGIVIPQEKVATVWLGGLKLKFENSTSVCRPGSLIQPIESSGFTTCPKVILPVDVDKRDLAEGILLADDVSPDIPDTMKLIAMTL